MNLYNTFKECLNLSKKFTHCENAGDFFVQRDGDTLKLYFEWSDDAEDWKNNFDFLPVSHQNGEKAWEKTKNKLKYFITIILAWLKGIALPKKAYNNMPSVFYCHRGFLNVWKSIEPHLVKDIHNLDIKKIDIVGYSHGAAIALLCYEYCIFNRPDVDVQGVGFGCPRVFWGFVPEAVKERFKNFAVVRNGKDIVTHVPPSFLGFRHISKVITIGKEESVGLIDDHRPENYLKNLKGVEME